VPTVLSITVKHICDRVPNPANSELIVDLRVYLGGIIDFNGLKTFLQQ